MWRVERVWRAGEEKKFWICRVPIKNTRQTYKFAECLGRTLGKVALLVTAGTPSDGRRTCRSRDSVLPSINSLPSVVLLFAESLIYYTLANRGFFTECNIYAKCLLYYTLTNQLFVECPMKCTRKQKKQLAYLPFPVVVDR